MTKLGYLHHKNKENKVKEYINNQLIDKLSLKKMRRKKKVKQLVISRELHQKYKIFCLKMGKSMKTITDFVIKQLLEGE